MWRSPYGWQYQAERIAHKTLPEIEWEPVNATHPHFYTVDESTKQLVKASANRFGMMVIEG